MTLTGKTIVAASSGAEQEEAPSAKKATRDDEQIYVRARDGEEVMISREVARLAGHLKDLMDDASSEGSVYPAPMVAASTLRSLVRMSELLSDGAPTHTDSSDERRVDTSDGCLHTRQEFEDCYGADWEAYWTASADEHSLLQLMEHVEGALFLDAPMLLKHNQSVIASRVNGKGADELRALLGAGSDFDGTELEAALAESAFLPEGYEAPRQHLSAASSTAPLAPLRQPSLSGVPATTDAREAALGMVDVATLCELKGVNRFWRALSRRVLCSRLCRGRGQPAPTHLEEITDLDIELLIKAGRPGDTALAGRLLPGLARLHGYGFVVDVAKVRAAKLGRLRIATLDDDDEEDNNDDEGNEEDEDSDEGERGSLLRGAAKAALDRCISGDGEAPLKLTIAAVACAGSGVVCGIPVQHMREDTKTELDLRNKGLCGPVAMLISYLIPAMGSLTSVDLSENHLTNRGRDMTGIKQLAAALGVNGSLTKMSLAENKLEEEGTKAICEALEQNKTLKELDISGGYGSNIGGLAGAKHVAKMLGVNGSLTALDLSTNKLKDEGLSAVCEAIQSNKETKLTSLNFGNNGVGPVGANAVAAMVAATGSLTSLNLGHNLLCGLDGLGRGTYTADGITAIADALRVNGVLTTIDLSDNLLCGGVWDDDGDEHGNYTAEGITAIADALRVNGSLTKIDLRFNSLDEGVEASIRNAVQGKAGFQLQL